MHPALILLIAVAIVLGGILWLRLHAFVALLAGALAVAVLTPVESLQDYARRKAAGGAWSERAAADFVTSSPGERVAGAFGNTCGSIGLLIAMASVIGKCLLDSGGAERIVRWLQRAVGEARAGLAFVAGGFLLSIPVFFDTVFLLMIPLGKAMYRRTGKDYLLYVLCILAGGTISHSLVPPTPGPLLVADLLAVDVGVMILAGTAVGAIAAAVGYLYACWANRRWELPMRLAEDSPAELERSTGEVSHRVPPLWLALLPVLLPVLLITGQTVLGGITDETSPAGVPGWVSTFQPVVNVLGNKNIATVLGAAVALGTLAWYKRTSRAELAAAVQSAVQQAGVIILISSAGGAFGEVLGQSGVGGQVAAMTRGLNALAVLPVAFLVTALVRTAQGSSTVAMITAAGLFQHFAAAGQLSFHPVYLALAIGCGSKLIAWMNDSGFWVVCKTSGMTETEALRTVSVQVALMGLAGLGATMLGAVWLPMV